MTKHRWSDLSGEERDAGWRILGGYARVREEPEQEPTLLGGTWGDAAQPPEPNGLHGLVDKQLASRDDVCPDVWDYRLTDEGRELFEAQA